MEEEDEGLRSGRMKEIRESPSPEQSSDRKVRPVASRSFGTIRDREKKNFRLQWTLRYFHLQLKPHIYMD